MIVKNVKNWAISNQAPKLLSNMEKAQRLSLWWGVKFQLKFETVG